MSKKYKTLCYKKYRTLCSISLKKYVYKMNIVEIFFIFHFYNTLFLSLFAIFYYLNLVNEI